MCRTDEVAKLRSEGFRHMQFVARMPDGWRNIPITLKMPGRGILSVTAWLQHPSVCSSESGVYSVGQSCSRFASIPQGCARDGGKETVTQSQPFRRLLRESLQSVFAPLTLTRSEEHTSELQS